MPKNRKRNPQKGAKSIAIHTSNKVGGRKSGKAAHEMSVAELEAALEKARKRDRNKLRRAWNIRTGVCV